jgi:predicted metal-dependent HD superfamily phosphohydrolase
MDVGSPRLSFEAPPSMLARVALRYEEPHRHYHTWSHVLACLEARWALTEASLPEVDLALLFHDAVYDPLAKDNEARSASLLLDEGRLAWMHERVLQRGHDLVLATRHAAADALDTEEACVVIDADLSILGADAATFEAYEKSVRLEYSMVDDAAFVAGRRGVLRSFLDRPSIYATRRGQRLWEARARRNLERSLAALGS